MRYGEVLAVSSLAVLLLTGCGGGSGDEGGVSGLNTAGATSPASLVTATDGAKAAAGARGLRGVGLAPLAGGTAAESSAGAALKSGGTKVSASVDCNGGGSGTATTDDSTIFNSDGSIQMNNCVRISPAPPQPEQGRLIFNGAASDRCTDSQQTANNCSALRIVAGQGEAPFSLTGIASGESSTIDLLGVVDDSIFGNTRTDHANMRGRVTDNNSHHSAGFVLTDFIYTLTSGQGTQTETLDGKVGISSDGATSANCIAGEVTVTTLTPITVASASQATTGGQLRVDSANGNTATITFNDDGTVTVVTNGGTPQTFTAAQFSAFCT